MLFAIVEHAPDIMHALSPLDAMDHDCISAWLLVEAAVAKAAAISRAVVDGHVCSGWGREATGGRAGSRVVPWPHV